MANPWTRATMSIVIGDDPAQVLSHSEIIKVLRLATASAAALGMEITADAAQDALETAEDEIRRLPFNIISPEIGVSLH